MKQVEMDLVTEQPAPVPNAGRGIWDLVMDDMRARDAVGRERYGMPLQAFNGRDPLVDAYQEALDQVVYVRQAIEERDHEPQVGDVYEDEGGNRWRFAERRCYVYEFRDGDGNNIVIDTAGSRFSEVTRSWKMRFVVPEYAQRGAMALEIRRLRLREQELLDASTRLIDAARGIDRSAMVRQFMRVFGQPMSANTGVVPPELTPSLHGFVGDDLIRFRLRLVVEEVFELLEASLAQEWTVRHGEADYDIERAKALVMGLIDTAPVSVNLPELIDATIDIDYVIEGFRATLGVDPTPLWQLVHASNMAKAGPDGVPRRRPEDGKVLKLDGWTPPDIATELRRQGWRG